MLPRGNAPEAYLVVVTVRCRLLIELRRRAAIVVIFEMSAVKILL